LKWYFQHWQDGDVTVQKTLQILGDITLTATYAEGFVLGITSSPVTVTFQINSVAQTTPFLQTLATGTYVITLPTEVPATPLAGKYVFSQWNDGSTNPTRSLALATDTNLAATYVYVAPPPAKGTLNVHAFLGNAEIIASGNVQGGATFQTPYTVDLDAGDYVVNCTSEGATKTQTGHVVSGQPTTLNFQFSEVVIAGFPYWVIPVALIGMGVVYVMSKKK